jgi:NADPH-dependent F420 reductase
MKIAVIGTGRMGCGLGQALAKDNEVVMASRDPDKAREVAKNIGVTGGEGYADAARDAEVVVLTVPWLAVPETLDALGDLSGRILVDVTNPYGPQGLVDVKPSSSEEVQRLVPGAKVVKGWSTVYARNIVAPDFDGTAASVFICGDDAGAKDVVVKLAKAAGFDPVDVGPLSQAANLTQLLGLMGALRWGPDTQLRLLRR